LQLRKDESAGTPPSDADDELRHLARKLASCQTIWTSVWHGSAAGPAVNAFLSLVQDEHRRNFDLWHEEDKARAPLAADSEIATVKRAIDTLNQQRNDLIEKLDEHLFQVLEKGQIKAIAHATWNSETPGSVIDRLSIVALKVYHMREQTERLDASKEHLKKCLERLKVLTAQHSDLTVALQNLFDDLFAGRKQMKIYRQFKMYNDPDSNPAIYGAKVV